MIVNVLTVFMIVTILTVFMIVSVATSVHDCDCSDGCL